MSAKRCPNCSGEAKDPGFPSADDPPWAGGLHCPRCEVELTPEELVVERTTDVKGHPLIREIGKGGFVIWEYRPDDARIESLLSRIAELDEDREAAPGEPIPLEQGVRKWNRKRAARRFRRWCLECDNRFLEIEDDRLRSLAQNILLERPEPELDGALWDRVFAETSSNQNGHLDRIFNYESTKASEPAVPFKDLRPETKRALREAQEAHRWGLRVATAALCRVVLEDVVRRAAASYAAERGPSALFREDSPFKTLLDWIPPEALTARARERALEIWREASAAVHKAGTSVDAELMYFHTLRIAQILLNRVGKNAGNTTSNA